MRASVSLTSFFSSLRNPTVSPHLFIPVIRIVSPTDPVSPHLSSGPFNIRRWRGALGTLGDRTLQLPSQGLTSGARLALARQGCATGSFRLNCSESLYVRDSRGLAMFQRIELEDELEKARLGLRERPPMRASAEANSTEPPDEAFSPMADRQKNRRPSLRTQRRNFLAMQGMRFESGGLSSCATFTEGLCNLEDYIRAGEADSAVADLPTVCSEQEISQLSASIGDPNSSWLDSLKMTFSSGNNPSPSGVKKRRSAGELVKSLSCVDLHASFSSEANLSLTGCKLSPASGIPGLPGEKQLNGTIRQPERRPAITSSGKLRREGSWTRLRRRLSGKGFMNQSDSLAESRTAEQSFSVATGLFRIPEQGLPTACAQPVKARV